MHLVDLDFSYWFVFWLSGFGFCLGGFRVPALLQFLSCFKEAAIMSPSSAKRKFDMQSLFPLRSLMPKSLSFNVFLQC